MLRNLLSSIFMVDRLQREFIFRHFQIVGEQVVWVFNLCKHLLDEESNELVQLLAKLAYLLLLKMGGKRCWSLDSKVIFSVHNFYEVLQGSQSYEVGWKWCWN